MVKRISAVALAGLIAMPAAALAGAGTAPQDLERKIEELARELDALKAQLANQNESLAEYGDKVDDMDELLEEKSEAWDLAARFRFYGDFRARGDYYSASNVFAAGTPLGLAGFDAAGMPIYSGQAQGDQGNDTLLTNRFRLNMRVKATENVEFKGRPGHVQGMGYAVHTRKPGRRLPDV